MDLSQESTGTKSFCTECSAWLLVYDPIRCSLSERASVQGEFVWLCSTAFVVCSRFRGLDDANGCCAVSNQPLNAPPLGRIVGKESQMSGVNGIQPADQRWGFWPLLPLSFQLRELF